MNEAYTDEQFIETLAFLKAKNIETGATAREVANTLQCHPNTVKTRLKELLEQKKIVGKLHGCTWFYWIR